MNPWKRNVNIWNSKNVIGVNLLIVIVFAFELVTCVEENSSRLVVDNEEKSVLDSCSGEDEIPKLVVLSDLSKYSHSGVKYEYLKIECSAPYPIKWDFKGNKPNDIYYNQAIVTDNYSKPTKHCYVSTLLSYKWSPAQLGRTGNYSCSSISNHNKTAWIYKFMDGANSSDDATRKVIFSSPRKVKVLANPNKSDWLLLPCASNTEKLNATLWKIEENGTVNPLPESVSQHYDPKIGFLVRDSQDDGSNASLAGNYICHTTPNRMNTDAVEVNVLEAPEYLATPETETVTPINGHVLVACEANEPIVIKISNIEGGTASEITSSGANVASNYNYSYSMNGYAVNEEGNISYGIKGIAECKTKSDKVLHSWKFDPDHLCQCSWHFLDAEEESDEDPGGTDYYEEEMFESGDEEYSDVSKKSVPNLKESGDVSDKLYLHQPELRGRIICSNSHNYLNVNFSLLHCGNENECDVKSNCLALNDCPFVSTSKKMNRTINGVTNIVSFMDITLQSGIIKCHVDGYTSTKNIIATLDNIYFEKVPDNATVINIRAPENKYVVGDKLIFSCEVEKYQLAEHLIWSFLFKNQSTNIIENIDPQDDKTLRNKYKIYRTSYIKIPSVDVSAIVCSAPVWPTREYKSKSFALVNQDVGPSVPNGYCEKSILRAPYILMHRNSSGSLNRTRATTIVHNYTITIENPVNQVKLVCRAPYPVQWIKDDELVTTAKNKWSDCETSSGMSQGTGKWYDAIIDFPSLLAKSTGNYTCRKVSNHAVHSCVYLFASGNGSKTILEEGKHITVVKALDDPDPWALFPCRTSNPKEIPNFYMDNADKPKLMKIDEHLKYDAKKGFSFDISSLSKDSPNLFYCSVNDDSNNYNVLYSLHRPDSSRLHNAKNSNATFILIMAFLLGIIAILSLAIIFLFRKRKENINKVLNGNIHQMSSTYTVSTENAVIDNDVEIANGNYRRFS